MRLAYLNELLLRAKADFFFFLSHCKNIFLESMWNLAADETLIAPGE